MESQISQGGKLKKRQLYPTKMVESWPFFGAAVRGDFFPQKGLKASDFKNALDGHKLSYENRITR